MQAKLPAGRATVDRSIASMDVDESGWVVPWAMYHDHERNLWLNGAYTLHQTPGGTAHMRIWRDDEGWHVDARACRDHSLGGQGVLRRLPADRRFHSFLLTPAHERARKWR